MPPGSDWGSPSGAKAFRHRRAWGELRPCEDRTGGTSVFAGLTGAAQQLHGIMGHGGSLLGLLLIFVLVLQFGEDLRMAQGVPVHTLWMGMSFFVAFLALGFVFFVLPFGDLALGSILGGIEQRLSWRRSDGRGIWVLQWGLGTTREELHHDELRAFRFEDHLVEHRTNHGKQTMESGRLNLMAQDGTTTELVSSGGLLETRKAAEALAEHFDLAHSSWVVRDGKVSASSEGG